jgi:hypothetical protein
VIGKFRFHRGCDAQRLVDSAEVVVHEILGNHVSVVFQFLIKPFCQAGEIDASPSSSKDFAFLRE